MERNWDALRHSMVEQQLRPRGIHDVSTLDAMETVPRHCFIPEAERRYSYDDAPVPIGEGQTISQPYIVALMTQAAELKPNDKVLEIGTGSGYAAAVLAQIVSDVYTVERITPLARNAQAVHEELGYNNIHVHVGDGTLGWKEQSPFDVIIVTAGAPVTPESLVDQLNIDGRLVIPVGAGFGQELLCLQKTSDGLLKKKFLEYVRFVPLIGEEGWYGNQPPPT